MSIIMTIMSTEPALLVVAGGKSSRMGKGLDKRLLEFGGESLLERILRKGSEWSGNLGEGSFFSEKILSVDKETLAVRELADRYGYTVIEDEAAGFGPSEGLRCGLSAMRATWAFAVSVDMPFFSFDDMMPLFARWQEVRQESDILAVIPSAESAVLSHGRRWSGKSETDGFNREQQRQPLAALYQRDFAEEIAKAQVAGVRKLSQMAEPYAEVLDIAAPSARFFNINTPADLRLARGRLANEGRDTPILSIVAPASGTGKTTFLVKLIRRLSSRGLRIAAVKSDSHGFNLDTEGKDSARFKEAGASGIAVVSPRGYFLEEDTEERQDLSTIAQKFQNIDLILTESRTHGTFPAFSLWRGKGEPMMGEDVVAVFSSDRTSVKQVAHENGIHTFHLDDEDTAESLAYFLIGRETPPSPSGATIHLVLQHLVDGYTP